MKAYRDENITSFKHSKGQCVASSWVLATAPVLGAPFRDNPAEESTLAAWISRAQVSVAVAITPEESKASKDGAGLPLRTSVLECVTGYAEFLRLPGSRPCRVVLAAARPPEQSALLAAAFKAAHERQLPSFPREPLQLQFCAAEEDPLPLALTTLITAAVLRYVDDPTVGNPIFHAVRPKFTRVPPALGSQRNAGRAHAKLS